MRGESGRQSFAPLAGKVASEASRMRGAPPEFFPGGECLTSEAAAGR